MNKSHSPHPSNPVNVSLKEIQADRKLDNCNFEISLVDISRIYGSDNPLKKNTERSAREVRLENLKQTRKLEKDMS